MQFNPIPFNNSKQKTGAAETFYQKIISNPFVFAGTVK